MADIFISYSKTDRELALKLSAYLVSEGWSVWWDKSLQPADTFRDEIMKQLAAARAVIVIWSETSIKSDWVRAEAGRAKADGKLIPIKTPSLTYADIPLPFGEMHTENITSLELIKGAVVSQLAKPVIPVSPFRQVTSAFQGQFLTWIGIVGGAITLFTNLGGVLNLSDWARQLVVHWHDWMATFWVWAFSWTGITVPKVVTPVLSFLFFAAMMSYRLNRFSNGRQRASVVLTFRNSRLFLLLCATLLGVITYFGSINLVDTLRITFHTYVRFEFMFFGLQCALSIVLLIFTTKEKAWVFGAAVLFAGCIFLGFIAPLYRIWHIEGINQAVLFSVGAFADFLLPSCLVAVVLLTPLRELTRRLTLLVLGMLTLIALNEISKLNLHQYLQAPKSSMIEEVVKSST
jgi:hypothetical protein